MKDFFKTSSFKVLLITVVVLLGVIIYTASAGSSMLANMLGFVSSPMQGVSTSVTDSVRQFTDLDGLTKDELKKMVADLGSENAALRDRVVDYEEKKQENEQLKVQLGIMTEVPENKTLSASVIGRDPGEVFYGFSIDTGTLAGVNVGDPVITDKGLVGIVSQAYATTSKVSCILSEKVKVAAMSKKHSESGVVTSDIQTAAGGLVRMNYLSGDTKIEKGDIITTSGAGNIYPKDLILGEVQSVEKSENDISRYAVIKPYEDIKSLKNVFVIVDFPGKGDNGGNVVYEDSPNSQSGEDPQFKENAGGEK